MIVQFATLYHHTDHGGELTVHPTEDAAADAKYDLAVSSWDNVFCLDGHDCGVAGCHGVPRDPKTLDRDEAIAAYFDHRAAFEHADIETHDVDVPVTAVLGDWAARARHELGHAAHAPGGCAVLRRLVEELLTSDRPHSAT